MTDGEFLVSVLMGIWSIGGMLILLIRPILVGAGICNRLTKSEDKNNYNIAVFFWWFIALLLICGIIWDGMKYVGRWITKDWGSILESKLERFGKRFDGRLK